jgi:hypothetical protein
MLIFVSIDIMFKSLKMNNEEIRAALASMSEEQFSVDHLQGIQTCLPTSDEVRWLLLVVFSSLLFNYFVLFYFRLRYWKDTRRYKPRLLELQSSFY